jgi:hypothetical protein
VKEILPDFHLMLLILIHLCHPTLHDRLSTADISNVSRYRSDYRHRRNATLAIVAFASADLYRMWKLAMLPRRQMENWGRLQQALLHALLGNGYRVRGSPLSFRKFAMICDNNSGLPDENTVSKATAASRRLPFVVGWLSSRAGGVDVSYLPRLP